MCHKLTTQPAKSILWKAFLHFLLVFFHGGCYFWVVSMEISLRGFWLMFLCACVGIYVIRGGLGGGDELGVQASSF